MELDRGRDSSDLGDCDSGTGTHRPPWFTSVRRRDSAPVPVDDPERVRGGDPNSTDPKAYFAYNQGYAWADPFLWAPIQIAGSTGMLLGARWGFLLALVASVPYVYTAITIFIWDRDLDFRENSATYWVIIWGIWPVFGLIQGTYSFFRLL